MPRSSGRARPARRDRRRTTWATFVQAINLGTDGAYVTVDLLANFRAAGGTTAGCTILRTHLLWSATAGFASPGDFFAHGLYRGQTVDVSASPAPQAPNPVTDLYEDWMLWEERVADNEGALTQYGVANGAIDLRAKRKIPELHMTYLYVITRGHSTATATVQVTGRVLLALP